MWRNESEALSLTDTESLSRKEPELLSRLEGILLKFMNFNPVLVHSVGTGPNQQGEIRCGQSWTNGRTAGDFILFTACLWWITGVVPSADPGWRSYI